MATFDSVTLLIGGIISFLLFLFLVFRKKDIRAIFLGLFCLGLSIHGFSGYLTSLTTINSLALFFNRLSLLGTLLSIPSFVHFTDIYLTKKLRFSRTVIGWYVASALFATIGIGAGFFSAVIVKPGGFTGVPGWAFQYFLIFVIISYLQVMYRFIGYLRSEITLDDRNRIKYLLTFLTILAISAILDMLRKMDIFRIADFLITEYAIILFAVGVTFTILKYRLLDINIVLHKSTWYSLIGAIVLILFEVLKDIIGELMNVFIISGNVPVSHISLLVITFLFEPIKNKTEKVCDKIFLKSS